MPTEYHTPEEKKHCDVCDGPCLDDVMKLEIPLFDKHLKK